MHGRTDGRTLELVVLHDALEALHGPHVVGLREGEGALPRQLEAREGCKVLGGKGGDRWG